MNKTLLLIASATALVPAALAGCGSVAGTANVPVVHAPAPKPRPAAAATSAAPIAIKLTEWAVTPATAVAQHGRVSFDVTNAGKVAHELVVLRTGKSASSLGHGARIKESGNVGEAGDLPVGTSKTFALTLTPGHYSLVCNLPGHYMSGMHADFTVR